MSSSPPPSGPVRPQAGDVQCRTCGSRVRPEEDWCSLCLTPVTEPDPRDSSPAAPADVMGDVDGTGAQAASPSPTAPTTGARTLDPQVAATADRLIEELASAEAARDGAGGWAMAPRQRLSGREGAMLALVGASGLLVVLIVGLTLLGLLL